MLQAVDGLELTTNVELLSGGEEVLDTGVGIVVAAEDKSSLLDPVSFVLVSSLVRTCPSSAITYLSGR